MKIEQVVEEKQLSYFACSLSLPDLSSMQGVIAFSVSACASTTSPGLIWKSVNGLNIMHIHQPHIYSSILALCICIEFDCSYLAMDYDQD